MKDHRITMMFPMTNLARNGAQHQLLEVALALLNVDR